MEQKAIIVFNLCRKNQSFDLEVPLNITANEFVNALNTAYDLQLKTSDIKNCYLKAENPIALLRGNKTLAEYGVRNGTQVNFTE